MVRSEWRVVELQRRLVVVAVRSRAVVAVAVHAITASSLGELGDSIAESQPIPLTDAQRAEFEQRYAEYEANPDDVTPWEQVRASILSRLGK